MSKNQGVLTPPLRGGAMANEEIPKSAEKKFKIKFAFIRI